MTGETTVEIIKNYQDVIEKLILFSVILVGLGFCAKILILKIINAVEPTGRGYENKIPPRGIRVLQE